MTAEEREKRDRTPTPELITAIRKTLQGFSFVWSDIDGVRRTVRLTPKVLGNPKLMASVHELAATITTLSPIDLEWLGTRDPKVAIRVLKRDIDRLEMAGILTGRGSPEWERLIGGLRRELVKAERSKPIGPRGGRPSGLPPKEVFREEFEGVLRYASEHWDQIRDCSGQQQRLHIDTICERLNLPESLNRDAVRKKVRTGSPARAPRSFAVRFLAGVYGIERGYVNRVLRKS